MDQTDNLFSQILPEAKNILDNFDSVIQDVSPLNSKQLQQLPDFVRELSHQLTDERSKRHLGYMNQTIYLSAYTRYFMWWNLYRLISLFSGFPKAAFDSLKDGDYCFDLGSGPLTVPIAMWLACPELRTKKLTWYCVDSSQTALSLGEELYLSIASKTLTENTEPWKIIRIKDEVGCEIRNPVSFFTCANMFNELYWNATKPLEEITKKYTTMILSYLKEDSLCFIAEPGIPRASRFITLTRDALQRKGFSIISPCSHKNNCPMDGRKGGKWCHFILDTENAPKKLHALSAKAGIPKERAAISFVFAERKQVSSEKTEKVNTDLIRVISDPIRLPGRGFGRYACSKLGLTLVLNTPISIISGSLIKRNLDNDRTHYQIDAKTNAVIVTMESKNLQKKEKNYTKERKPYSKVKK